MNTLKKSDHLKILHIYKNYYPVVGGIENYIKILAEYQAKNGYDVTVLAISASGETIIENINSVKVIKSSRINEISSTPLSLSFFKWVRRLRADIIHLHFPYPPGEFATCFWGYAKHTVITYHSDIIEQKFILKLYKPFLLKILKKADCIIATSPQYIETSPFLRKFKEKCVVIPLGIDVTRFNKLDTSVSDDIREKYKKERILLFIGRLRPFKGVEYLIESMRHVDAVLLIIGSGSEENRLKTLAATEGLKDKIVFLREIPNENIPEYFDVCDIFILPSSSRSESFGTVLIEAMAAGKAVISTELGTGTSFVNIHGKTGFVVPPRDPHALAKSVNRLLADEPLRKEFGVNAKKRSEEFSSERLTERVDKLYEEVLKDRLLREGSKKTI